MRFSFITLMTDDI